MNIPIITLYNTLKTLLNDVKTDLTTNQLTPTKSWLYREFGGLSLEGYNFYENLKHNIQLTNDTRQLELRLMYDPSRANLPTMHLIYPAENTRSGSNFIGTGDLGTDENGYSYKSRSFVGDYEIIITGVNSVQVVSLYEFLDALLIASADKLASMFDIFHFNGKQLMLDPESYNLPIFYRSVGVSVQVNKVVSKLDVEELFDNISFSGEYYTDNQQYNELISSVSISTSNSNPEVGDVCNLSAFITGLSDYDNISWYVNGLVVYQNTLSIDYVVAKEGVTEIKCVVTKGEFEIYDILTINTI